MPIPYTDGQLPDNIREFDDTTKTRDLIYGNVLDALKKSFPRTDGKLRLELGDIRYSGPQKYSLAQQKKALMSNRSLRTAVSGKWKLVDEETGETLDEREDIIAHVPYYTRRGTVVNRGNEYTIVNQARLKPGVYTRTKLSGEHEAQFNVRPGTGKGFRIWMEPATGIFRVNVGQANIPAYPFLRTMGVTDKEMQKAWGAEVLDANIRKTDSQAIPKLYRRFSGYKYKEGLSEDEQRQYLKDEIPKFELDPNVVARTLGVPNAPTVTPQLLLRSTQKLLNVSRGDEDTDNRESPEFSTIHSAEDFVRERIELDAGRTARDLLWKARRGRNLQSVPRGALNPYFESLMLNSGLASPLEETNPFQLMDQQNRIIKLGEGGIGSAEAVTDEARDVNPNQAGFIDLLAGPESEKIGIDVRTAFRTFKGQDKQLYAEFNNIRTGKPELLRPEELSTQVLSFPGEAAKAGPRGMAYALKDGQMVRVPAKEVDYEIPSFAHMYGATVNTVPMPTGFMPTRGFYAAKYWSQYLPMVKGEVPLVQSQVPGTDQSFVQLYGRKIGGVSADKAGIVTRVTSKGITLRDAEGKKHVVEMVENFPFNRMTALSYFPKVKPGDVVKKGDMLAHSNFTDKETGAINMGINLKTAVVPYEGFSFEDAYVISESASKKLATERLYGFDKESRNGVTISRNRYASVFPKKYTKDQYENIDENGVIREGATVRKGDPLFVAVGPKVLSSEDAELGRLHKALRNSFRDEAVEWEHGHPGVVTDVGRTTTGFKVNVKAQVPADVGDKLSNAFASKGVVGKVVPDDEMPRDPDDDQPYEMLMNPMVVLSRGAPNQIVELQLAKVAKKTGKPYILPSEPPPEGWEEFARRELEKAGLQERKHVYAPGLGREIKGLGEGYMYMSAFHHLAEKKLTGRDTGGYTADYQPGKGSKTGAKKMSLMDVNALLAHSAPEVIRDSHLIRGNRNEDYWNALRMGRPLPEPEVPFIYEKFMNTLKAGGINVKKKGDIVSIMPLTDQDITDVARGEIKGSGTVDARTFEPVRGGLFDQTATGGLQGRKWTTIKLHEPMPNPVMEEPIRRLLGLRVQDYLDVIAGRQELGGMTGGGAIKAALTKINVDEEIERHRQDIGRFRGAKRDNAVKALRYLSAAKKQKINPEQWVISSVPVIPPIFRPISQVGDTLRASDMNGMYRDVIETNNSLKALSKDLPGSALADERVQLYKGVTAAFGLGEPITPEGVSKRWKGAIRQVIGTSPKCYDDKTEILTRDGWVDFPEYVGGIEVATVNPETHKFEWQLPTHVLHKQHVGPMVHTKTKKLDLLVTPGHHHWLERRIGKGTGEAQWSVPEKVQAGDLVGKTRRVRYHNAADGYAGTTPAPMFDGVLADPEAFAQFTGLWAAEGWIGNKGKKSDPIVYIAQASGKGVKNVEVIEDLFMRMGLVYTRADYTKKQETKYHRKGYPFTYWSIESRALAEWLIQHVGDGAGNKRLSTEILSWDEKYLRGVLQFYLFGDGERHAVNEDPSENKTFYNRSALLNTASRFNTTSSELVDNLAELCVKVGLGFGCRDYFEFEEKEWAPQWRCRVFGWNRVIVEYPEQTQLTNYDGMVHCVTVPNGLVVVRRNGFTAVSGNTGMFQNKVLSKNVDVVGRGVVAPDPTMDMDTIGIPEEKAWVLYRPFIMRAMVRRGFPPMKATELIDNRSPEAEEHLLQQLKERPVILDRAPTWHKFNLLAFKPRLVKEDVIRVSPLIVSGFNMDFDGDAANFHVPVSDKAVRQATEKMLPSRNLFALTDLQSPQHTPSKEMAMGLYQLTRKSSGKSPVIFETVQDLKKAMKEGLVGINDPVIIQKG